MEKKKVSPENEIIDHALALLAKFEKGDVETYFTLKQLCVHLAWFAKWDGVNEDLVKKVLDENFDSKYTGKEIRYSIPWK